MTATTAGLRPFASRGPLGPWARWALEQRQVHGWSPRDLASVLWGEDSAERQSVQVRRWEAAHWSPGEEACRRLVAAFGAPPADIELPTDTSGRAAGHEEIPARAAIVDAFTRARDCLGYDPGHDPYQPTHLDDPGTATPGVVDLTDLDALHLHDQDDEDGWDL